MLQLGGHVESSCFSLAFKTPGPLCGPSPASQLPQVLYCLKVQWFTCESWLASDGGPDRSAPAAGL